MATPRSPERAKAVLDRASRMSRWKASMLDQRIGDRQMRTPGNRATPFNLNTVDPKSFVKQGRSVVPLSQIVSDQPTISVKAAKSKVDRIAKGETPQIRLVQRRDGKYIMLDGNHGTTAYRALGQKSVEATIYKIEQPKPASPAPVVHQVGKIGLPRAVTAGLTVVAPAVAAATAFDMARKAAAGNGAGENQALAAGAAAGVGAGAVAAGVGYAAAKGLGAGVRALTAAAPMLGKVAARAVPGLGMAVMAYGALEGFRKGGDLKSAALGAIGADHFIEPKARPVAYLNATAEAKSSKPAAPITTDSSGGRPAAALPRSDGMTAGYQRVDPRTGTTVDVKSYSTPDRP